MFLSAFLSLLGLGVVVYAFFYLAVLALPTFVAISVGLYVYNTDAGLLPTILSGVFAGTFTFVPGQVAFAKSQSKIVRLIIGTIYAAPAGVAGFHAVKGISEATGTSGAWALAFAWIDGTIVFGTAWVQIASLAGLIREDREASQSPIRTNRPANDG